MGVGGGGGSMFKYDCMDRCLPNVSSTHPTSYVYTYTLLLPVQKPVVKCIFYLAYTVYYSWKITSDIFIRDDNHL